MTWSASGRSVALRVTGVSAALGLSFLAGSARAEVLSQHLLDARSPSAAAGSSFVAAVLDVQTGPAPTSAHASSAARAVLEAPAAQGYSAAPPKPVFSESILIQPEFPVTLSLVRQSAHSHLTGIVRTPLRQ
jgi:hypothetical protein